MGADSDTWKVITPSELGAEALAELAREHPCRITIMNQLNVLFRRDTGVVIADKNTADEVTLYARWLAHQCMNGEAELYSRRFPRLQQVLNATYASKVSSLAQRSCFHCEGTRGIDELANVTIYPVRLPPLSRQATPPALLRAYKRAAAAWFSGKSKASSCTGSYCVAMTFVMSERRRDKDLDNVVKLFQDALAPALGFNDRDIHHLDVVKLILPTDEEYIYVRLAPSALNEHRDVLAKTWHHRWGTNERVDLSDYIDDHLSGKVGDALVKRVRRILRS